MRQRLNRVFRNAALSLGIGLISGVAAFAEPIKVESENIILYGDVNAEAAQKIVRDLEIYRRTIFAMVNKTPRAADKKLTIYSFDSERPLAKFFGNKGTAGLYTNGADGPIFINVVKKAYRKGKFEEQVAKHEFSHHVLHAIVEDDFPRWYDEGFANYLSSFDVEGDVITVGAPTVAHGKVLERGRLMNVNDVLSSIRVYPWNKKGDGASYLSGAFYGQSWLYVHYMQNNPAYGKALPDYLARLKKGVAPLQAFEGAFGVTPLDFHNQAKKYFAADAFPVLQFKAQPVFLDVAMETDTIDTAALELELLSAQSNILGDDNKGDYRKRLDRVEDGLGQTPRVMTARAQLELAEENYAAAVKAAEIAKAATPDDLRVMRMLGDAYKGRSQAKRWAELNEKDEHTYKDNADVQTALSHYHAVLVVAPEDRHSVRQLVSLYGRSDMPVDAELEKITRYFEDSIFQSRNPQYMMSMANIYMRIGDTDRACSYYKGARGANQDVKTRYKTDVKARIASFQAKHGETCSS